MGAQLFSERTVKQGSSPRGIMRQFKKMAAHQKANIQALNGIAETLLWRYNGARPDGSKMQVYCANKNLQTSAQRIGRSFFSEILSIGLGGLWINADDLSFAIKAAEKRSPELSKSYREISEYVARNKTTLFSQKFSLSCMHPKGQRMHHSGLSGYNGRNAVIKDRNRVLAQALDQ